VVTNVILYNQNQTQSAIKNRPIKTLDLKIEEKPERPQYVFKSNRDRKKYIDMVKAYVRASDEYKDYIKFLKKNVDMSRCIVLQKLITGNGKKYSIEIHHDPFSLFDIINIMLAKSEADGQPHNPYKLAEAVTELHYDNKVGLVPLAKTSHELVENGKIFVPLQYMYQQYDKFYDEYEEFMDDNMKAKIQLKVQMSLKCDQIVSDCMDTEFTYIKVDGWDFPEISEEWGKALKLHDPETAMST